MGSVMPKVSLPVPETYQSITRPVYQAVIKQLLANTDVREVAVIGSLGDQEALPLNGSGHFKEAETAVFSHREKVLVRYREDHQEQTLLAQPAVAEDGRYIFSDPLLKVGLRPVYSMIDCTLSVVFRGEDKQQILRWRDDIVRQIRNNRAEQLYEATYQYPISEVGIVTLMEIHRLREATAPYGDTFAKYWKDHTPDFKLTYLSTQAGGELLPVVTEQQVNILGYLDFTIPPEETKGEHGATWEVSFDFKFQYQRPITFVLDFPIAIHQRLVPGKFYDRRPNYTPEWLADKGKIDSFLDAPRDLNWVRKSNYLGIIAPHYDDWVPSVYSNDFINLFTALVAISPQNLRHVINLNELGVYSLKPQFLTYLLDQRVFAFGSNRMALQLEVYENDRPLPYTALELQPDGTVLCNRDLDLRSTYRIRINVLHYLDRLSTEDSTTLRKYPEVCIPVLRWLYPKLDAERIVPTVVANRIVKKEDYELVIPKIKVIAKTRTQSFELRWWMFNEAFIITQRSA